MKDLEDNQKEPSQTDDAGNRYEDLFDTYPIVFRNTSLSESESCMAFGVECGPGWYDCINTMSARLEFLNERFYRRYGLYIAYDQIKEKHGLLTVYWSVCFSNLGIFGKTARFMYSVAGFIRRHANFRYRIVEDRPASTETRWVEISKELYHENPRWDTKEEDGKFYKRTIVEISPKSHSEISNHKILHFIFKTLLNIGTYLDGIVIETKKKSVKRECLRSYMHDEAHVIVNDATKAAYDTCEICGHQIGTRFNPRCTTAGWISYVCEDCARKNPDRIYYKNDVKMMNGKPLD